MQTNEILKKVIEEAVRNGFTKYGKFGEVVNEMIFFYKKVFYSIEEFIFDPEFLKAFFGENTCDCDKSSTETMTITCGNEQHRGWKYHAQQLVISEDRIKYLERFI